MVEKKNKYDLIDKIPMTKTLNNDKVKVNSYILKNKPVKSTNSKIKVFYKIQKN